MGEAPARVVFTSGFSRRYTGGVTEFQVEAKNLRGIIREMDRLFPGLGEHLEEETTVAIDGAIHETGYFQPVPPGAEVFFIPKIEGGCLLSVVVGLDPAIRPQPLVRGLPGQARPRRYAAIRTGSEAMPRMKLA